MNRFLTGLVACLLPVCLFAQNRAADIRKVLLNPQSETVLVAAHRASHLHYPENSIPALRDAIRLGVDIIEIDAKVSADGVVFLMHDGTIDRTTTGKGNPEKMRWEELSKLFLTVNGKPTSEKIPTLEEALLTVKGLALVDLDMKTDDVQAVLEVVRKTGTEDQVIFFDSDREVLNQIQSAGNFMVMPRAKDKKTTEEVLQLYKPAVVHIDPSFNTPDVVSLIKSSNARAWINALGAVDKQIAAGRGLEGLKPLLAAGANIVQTDYPQLLTGLLDQLGKRKDLPALMTKASASGPMICAHRGKISSGSVENSLQAIEQALQSGVDYIEIDVRTTRDGVLVNFHDGKLDRMTSLSGTIRERTFEELRKVSLSKSENEKIPSLEEVAGMVSNWNRSHPKPVHLYVDAKDVTPEQLHSALKKHNIHHDAVFYGSDEFLGSLRIIDPEVKVMPSLKSLDEVAEKIIRLNPYAFDVKWRLITPDVVKLLHTYQVRVFTDLLGPDDNRKNYRKALKAGVDLVQTDNARVAVKTLK